MNICIVCQGDGVLLCAGHWYCIDHLADGFANTARIVARLKGSADEERALNLAEKWYDEL